MELFLGFFLVFFLNEFFDLFASQFFRSRSRYDGLRSSVVIMYSKLLFDWLENIANPLFSIFVIGITLKLYKIKPPIEAEI